MGIVVDIVLYGVVWFVFVVKFGVCEQYVFGIDIGYVDDQVWSCCVDIDVVCGVFGKVYQLVLEEYWYDDGQVGGVG